MAFEIGPSDFNPYQCVHFYQDQNVSPSAYQRRQSWYFLSIIQVDTQHWVFELLPVREKIQTQKTFESQWFQLTPEKAATDKYDIIVIGTGMGAGVVAGDLFDTNSRLGVNAKSVLVIEKGGLSFHSHCLDAARPSGYGVDRGQQNDTFFALFRDNYTFKNPDQSKLWKGGPMFNVGGRGAAWGLQPSSGPIFPRRFSTNGIQKPKLWCSFPSPWQTPSIRMSWSVWISRPSRKWQWGRIASEFSESKNFDFALGAYSPIDKILEIAMSKDRDDSGACIEHPNWKILINTQVRKILWDDNRAIGVVVRDANGDEVKISSRRTVRELLLSTPRSC